MPRKELICCHLSRGTWGVQQERPSSAPCRMRETAAHCNNMSCYNSHSPYTWPGALHCECQEPAA
jgi:hypothetical protein